jgi:hypothetical protein
MTDRPRDPWGAPPRPEPRHRFLPFGGQVPALFGPSASLPREGRELRVRCFLGFVGRKPRKSAVILLSSLCRQPSWSGDLCKT